MDKRLDLNELRKRIADDNEGLIEFCKDLVRTPSVNGKDKEVKVSQLVYDKAKELNLPVDLISLDKNRPNVFVGESFDKKDGLLFVAHLDTVPTGDVKNWKYDPFGAEEKDGKLFGRGAIDCKAGIALSVYALKVLKDLGYGNIAKFAGVVDEESGADSDLGARHLLKKGLNATSAIYTYPGVNTVTIGHRGLVRLWVDVKGKTAHTGSLSWQTGEKGANAIGALTRFINVLSEVTMDGNHKFFPGYTFKHTPTIIEGGNGESIVPDSAKVLIDARLLPNHNNKVYIKRIEKLAAGFNSRNILFNVKVKTNISGVIISPDEEIVQILKRLDKEVMGISPEIRGCGPANEGYMFINAGIPTICGFGAEGDGVHSADEYLKLDSLPKILEMYVRAALELSF